MVFVYTTAFDCDEYKIVHYGCNSRICTHCGKKYTDKWAEKLTRLIFNVPHRHIILTVPEQLRQPLKEQRHLLKVLMDTSIVTLSETMSYQLQRGVKPGIVAVLHTYGKDMKFNPHVDMLVTEGGFDKNSKWFEIHEYWYKVIRRKWQYHLLTNLKKAMPDTKENQELIDYLFKKYHNGFYVRAKDRIDDKKKLAKYVGRYMRHPIVAEFRITNYDGKNVTFWYENNERIRYYVTMTVESFISAIIGHIPDKQFKIVRYYSTPDRKGNITERYSSNS